MKINTQSYSEDISDISGIQEKTILLGTQYLQDVESGYIGNEVIKHDRVYSKNGWQYKRYGNSTEGEEMLSVIESHCQLLADLSFGAKNDSDCRFFINRVYKITYNSIVEVTLNPSRSDKSKIWKFFFVKAKETQNDN